MRFGGGGAPRADCGLWPAAAAAAAEATAPGAEADDGDGRGSDGGLGGGAGAGGLGGAPAAAGWDAVDGDNDDDGLLPLGRAKSTKQSIVKNDDGNNVVMRALDDIVPEVGGGKLTRRGCVGAA